MEVIVKVINKLFVATLMAYIVLYFISTIWKEPVIIELLSLTGFLMLFSIFLSKQKQGLTLPILLITFSMIVVWITASSPWVLWIGLREMSAIITLIILISLVNWIISHRPYVLDFSSYGRDFHYEPGTPT
jgi:hypothetical protein